MPMANRPSSPTDSEKTITYDSEGEYVETVMYMPCKMCRGLHSFPTKYYPNPTIEKRKVCHSSYITTYNLLFLILSEQVSTQLSQLSRTAAVVPFPIPKMDDSDIVPSPIPELDDSDIVPSPIPSI